MGESRRVAFSRNGSWHGKKKPLDADILRAAKWKEFEMRVEAYRYYINIGLQVNVFFYVTTGVVLGFYFSGIKEQSVNDHSELLLLPSILMAVVLGGIFICAAMLQREAADIIKVIRVELNDEGLDIKEIPDISLLNPLLVIFGSIFFLVAALLIVVPRIGTAAAQRHLAFFTVIAIVVLGGGIWATIGVACRINKNLKNPAKTLKNVGNENAPAG